MALHSSEKWTQEDGVIRVLVAYVDVGNREYLAARTKKTGGPRINKHTIAMAEIKEKGSPSPFARGYEG